MKRFHQLSDDELNAELKRYNEIVKEYQKPIEEYDKVYKKYLEKKMDEVSNRDENPIVVPDTVMTKETSNGVYYI